MPLVVLIGDSIRMGYQEMVREELREDAEVWAPEENGGDSGNVLAHLDEWVVSRRPEVLHLNCGLHDLKTNRDTGVKQVPLPDYRRNLENIFTRVDTECPETAVIWATTTPVIQDWHERHKPFDRFQHDVEEYNAAALEIAERHGARINDLFTFVTANGKDNLLLPDGVHFNEAGCDLLGRAAVTAIRNAL